MTNFSDSLGETASYSYYSDGLRASKTIGSNTTKYYYDGDSVINETLNGNSYATNVLGADGYISRKQNGTVGYLFKNAHGDVLSAYSSTTNKLAAYTYDAWGNEQSKTETSNFTNNPLRYCGEYQDLCSGLIYLRNRYYDPSIGRFISEDTHWNVDNMISGNNDNSAPDISAIIQSSNLYVYGMNNPVKYTDPTGYVSKEAAANVIRNNATYIKNAAKEYGVNPGILAATIYAEQVLNVTYTESMEDYAQAMLGLNCSVGISQVRISTAKKVEDAGYISKTYSETIVHSSFSIFGKEIYTTTEVSRESNIYDKLINPETNIRYAAAYMAMIQDMWKEAYPEIDGRTAILATLYNIGENGSHGPNSNPQSRPFGDFAKENYYYMKQLLGLD